MRNDKILQGCGVGVSGLLQEPVEQQATASGGAAGEAESELVQVVGQLFREMPWCWVPAPPSRLASSRDDRYSCQSAHRRLVS